ncbi:methionyl-tRNA formyltransferase [Lentisphaerota bacterium ZTH]|nr:methionyl-tRNA formyltransferase [Lentisphaerota bacterium]WET06412.1 methionyl-tRNA formyltransferase [Lentisphaerota bacterium ZTH]
MSEKIKVYFMGSGKIAVPVLEALLNAPQIELLGITTQIDQRAGRRKKLTPTPVGAFAAENELNIIKAPCVNDGDYLCRLKALQPDFIVVVSFGQILRQALLDIPKNCCLNVHASVLPHYRGASPIAAAILNRDHRTGVTLMRMDKGLDTGDIYRIVEMELSGQENADELELKLGRLAANSVADSITDIYSGICKPVPQDNNRASLTRKIKKCDCVINWEKSAKHIEAMVRAFHPWPGTSFIVKSKKGDLKINVTSAEVADSEGKPGEVLQADKKALIVGCGKQALSLKLLVPQGKKEMSGPAFLNGHRLEKGVILGN